MRSRIMVVVHDLDEVVPVERWIAALAAEGAVVHVVSADDAPAEVPEEFSPRRLRLMLLLARLADAGVVVTGEDAWLADPRALPGAVEAFGPDEVHVAASSPSLPAVADARLEDLGVPVIAVRPEVGVVRGAAGTGSPTPGRPPALPLQPDLEVGLIDLPGRDAPAEEVLGVGGARGRGVVVPT